MNDLRSIRDVYIGRLFELACLQANVLRGARLAFWQIAWRLHETTFLGVFSVFPTGACLSVFLKMFISCKPQANFGAYVGMNLAFSKNATT